jgi:hypothetical protein
MYQELKRAGIGTVVRDADNTSQAVSAAGWEAGVKKLADKAEAAAEADPAARDLVTKLKEVDLDTAGESPSGKSPGRDTVAQRVPRNTLVVLQQSGACAFPN